MQRLTHRKVVVILALYLVYLLAVLVIFPSAGSFLYGWERREKTIQGLLIHSEDEYSILGAQGLVTAVRRVDFGYRYVAVFHLTDGERGMLSKSIFYLSDPYVQKAGGGREKLSVGDRITIEGTVSFPEGPRNPGGFDERLYDRTNHIDMKIKPDLVLKTAASDPVFSFLACSRDEAAERIKALWQQPYSGVICAMLLGDKSLLEDEIQESFSEAGIAHIIAISGLHISIIAEGIEKLLQTRLGQRRAGRLSLAMIWLYAIWTGGALATIRAALMLSVRRSGRLFSRSYDPVCSIAVSMLVILLIEPLYFLSSGFWLSYMALIGFTVGRVIVMRMRVIPHILRRWIASSCGVMLLSAPIVLWSFYVFSPLSFLLNLWVIPSVAIVIGASFLAMVFSVISPGSAGGFIWISKAVIDSYRAGSRLFSRFQPFLLTGRPTVRWMILYYLILFLLWLFFSRKRERQRMIRSLSVIVFLAVLALLPKNERIVTFLDVGQGDCAVIEWEGSVIIVDAGPGFDEVLDPYLKRQGIRRIDALFISHPDSDHIQGAIELSESGDYDVCCLILADQEAHNNEHSRRLEEAVIGQGGEVYRIRAGDSLKLPGKDTLTIDCLSPSREYEETNDGSLVLLFRGSGASFLFAGDISIEAEERIVREGWLEAAIEVTALKAAHHGSAYSTGDTFLEKVHPRLTIISCGVHNVYGHPAKEMLQRLQDHHDPWRVTAENGCIQIQLYRHSIQFRQFRDPGG